MKNSEGLRQWHETRRIEEGGLISFLKKYEPNSYEIKNEVGWLMADVIKSCRNFAVPQVQDFSFDQGYIKMDFIEEGADAKPQEEVLGYLVDAAVELHSLIKSEKPSLRTQVTREEYNDFLKTYTQKRIDSLRGTTFELPEDITQWIYRQIESLRKEYFTIVHRDMRARHLLFPQQAAVPTLVDWEFSNVSDPAQDVAKIIYDATTHDMDYQAVTGTVMDRYTHERKLARDAFEERVATFLPIIPLEHAMSYISRKPEGYEAEILKDLYFIRTVYGEKK